MIQVLLSTQAKENLTVIWMHFIMIFLQDYRPAVRDTSGLMGRNGTDMVQGS